MTRYALIPLMVLMLYSATSFGFTVGHPSNNSNVSFRYHQHVSISCSDTSEVEWKVDSTEQAVNHMKEISPNEKVLEIDKITPYDTGIYKCVSKKNSNLFKRLVVTVYADRLGAKGVSMYPSSPYTGELSLKT